jgi:hypothetical protein
LVHLFCCKLHFFDIEQTMNGLKRKLSKTAIYEHVTFIFYCWVTNFYQLQIKKYHFIYSLPSSEDKFQKINWGFCLLVKRNIKTFLHFAKTELSYFKYTVINNYKYFLKVLGQISITKILNDILLLNPMCKLSNFDNFH